MAKKLNIILDPYTEYPRHRRVVPGEHWAPCQLPGMPLHLAYCTWILVVRHWSGLYSMPGVPCRCSAVWSLLATLFPLSCYPSLACPVPCSCDGLCCTHS